MWSGGVNPLMESRKETLKALAFRYLKPQKCLILGCPLPGEYPQKVNYTSKDQCHAKKSFGYTGTCTRAGY